jgi:glycosyltransferase involved in cell wall biosynthesis
VKLLHYALGFPPYRTGGLTKYCMDLMLTQKEQGHDVALLWPGRMGVINNKLSIKHNKNIDKIHNFEIVNPLPVALDEGIPNTKPFIEPGEITVYKQFLNEYNPDIIHIHTLMGLHKEFVEAAKELGIKSVFTTHDYYGICPKVTLFKGGQVCNSDNDCRDCVSCNQTGLSIKKIKLMQSPIYRCLKNASIMKIMRKRHRAEFFEQSMIEENILTDEEVNQKVEGYRRFRNYYLDILDDIDLIHFNSTVSEMVYRRYITPKNSKVMSISHRDIGDHRKIKDFAHEKLRITYLAPAKPLKGFNILREALDRLWSEGFRDFELNMFSLTNQIRPYMKIQDGYQYRELESIFDKTDLLVAPSACYETFGFTVLEALSYGVPTLVSKNVGAKDLIENESVISINGNTLKNELARLIKDRSILEEINKKLCANKNMISLFNMHGVELYI